MQSISTAWAAFIYTARAMPPPLLGRLLLLLLSSSEYEEEENEGGGEHVTQADPFRFLRGISSPPGRSPRSPFFSSI